MLHSPGEVIGTCSLDWRKALISQGQPLALTGDLLLGSQSGQRGLDMVGVLSLDVEVGLLPQIVLTSDKDRSFALCTLHTLSLPDSPGTLGLSSGDSLMGSQDRAAGTRHSHCGVCYLPSIYMMMPTRMCSSICRQSK